MGALPHIHLRNFFKKFFIFCTAGGKENPPTAGGTKPNENNINPDYIRCRSRDSGTCKPLAGCRAGRPE